MPKTKENKPFWKDWRSWGMVVSLTMGLLALAGKGLSCAEDMEQICKAPDRIDTLNERMDADDKSDTLRSLSLEAVSESHTRMSGTIQQLDTQIDAININLARIGAYFEVEMIETSKDTL